MDSVNSLLGNAGSPRRLSVNGRKYVARLIDQGLKTEWERWLEDQALKPFLRLAGRNATAFNAAVKAISEESLQRKYAWGGQASNDALGTMGGFLGLIAIVFGQEEQPLPEEEARTLFEKAPILVQAAMDTVMVESFPDRAEAIRARIAERDRPKEKPDPNA